MLRIRKVIQYLADKTAITLDSLCVASPGALKAGIFVELYCNDKLLNPRQTLATVKYIICKGGSPDLVFYYLER